MTDNSANNIAEQLASIEQDILAARNLIRDGSLEQATELLSNLVSTNTSGYAKLQLANAYRYLGRYTESVTLIDALLVQAKEQRDALLTIAGLLIKGEAIIDLVSFDAPDAFAPEAIAPEAIDSLDTTDNKNSDAWEVQSAIESFGQALGISELLGEERLSILPLAGLAHAHWLWGNPKKAAELAERSIIRAQAIDTAERELFLARAYLSLAIIQQTPEAFHKATEQATLAKHRPLEKRTNRFQKLYQS